MTDSINFIEHTEEGTLVELKGNIHYVDGKACMRIADFKQILRIYNGYRGRSQVARHRDLTPAPVGSNPAAPSIPDPIDEALECVA